MNFFDLIEKLDDFHQNQLIWAHRNKGNIVPFTQIKELNFVIHYKGIYKPEGWKYAVSVSKRLGSNYEDGEVTYDSTGAWKVNYKPERDLSEYTNKALIENQRDSVPLVFFDQVSKKPQKSTYKVVGNCLPQFEKKNIEFLLFGFDDEGKINDLI